MAWHIKNFPLGNIDYSLVEIVHNTLRIHIDCAIFAGYLLLESLVSAGREWVVWLELIPGFALYRGLFEISQYGFIAAYQDSQV